jgi:hypothetical protein
MFAQTTMPPFYGRIRLLIWKSQCKKVMELFFI